ncbi:hypothetical protein JXM67_09600 [candidate division WOR-3 bacterium]|nr:hypothetical protein [candidate division WOR-3 bacterium]
MCLFLFLIVQTVPLEYPYFDIVRREVEFVPQPKGIDTATYERDLKLRYAEDSLLVIVEGTIIEKWAGDTQTEIQEVLGCDSVRITRDTVYAFSSMRFEFTASYANVLSSEMITAMRYADEKNYSVKEILARFGLENRKYRILADAGSLVTVGFKRSPGMVFMNLATGAVIGMEMREPVENNL